MKDIPDASVDLIICDLPYGCFTFGAGKQDPNVKPSEGRKIVSLPCAWDIKINLEEFWKEIKRIRKSDHTPTIHFCTTKFGIDLIQSNPQEFRYDLVWDKGRGVSFLSANKMPMRSHEMIYVFSKAGAFYSRIDEDAPGKAQRTDGASDTPRKDNMFGNGLKMSNGALKDKACVKSVIQIKKVGVKTQGHPTEKPRELYQWLIERYCPLDGTVLDPTFGSGNSVFTAYELNRNAIGIEKDKVFFDKAVKRLETLE